MNEKKARMLRKALGMTRENHRQKDMSVLKKTNVMTYVADGLGNKKPKVVEKVTYTNGNLAVYRRIKKNKQKMQELLVEYRKRYKAE